MNEILSHSDLQEVKKWMLATDDAHGLYSKFGFHLYQQTGKLMERINPTFKY